jgi:rhodanese-related sulfurtransferase
MTMVAMNRWMATVVLACAALVMACSTSDAAFTVVGVPADVDVTTAAGLRDAGAVVLDVREPAEWAEGHIPGATLIPLGELARRVSELPNDETIVVICRSGNRSAQGRDLLLAAGYEATSVDGGMTAWRAAGLPVESGG